MTSKAKERKPRTRRRLLIFVFHLPLSVRKVFAPFVTCFLLTILSITRSGKGTCHRVLTCMLKGAENVGTIALCACLLLTNRVRLGSLKLTICIDFTFQNWTLSLESKLITSFWQMFTIAGDAQRKRTPVSQKLSNYRFVFESYISRTHDLGPWYLVTLYATMWCIFGIVRWFWLFMQITKYLVMIKAGRLPGSWTALVLTRYSPLRGIYRWPVSGLSPPPYEYQEP